MKAAYRAARAKGGAALTVLGTNIVHSSSTLDYGVLANLDDSYIPGYKLVSDAVHAHGAAIFAQLNHQGGTAVRREPLAYLSAPSPVPSHVHNEIPRPMDRGMIHQVVATFATAAERCRRGGLTGCLSTPRTDTCSTSFSHPIRTGAPTNTADPLKTVCACCWMSCNPFDARWAPTIPSAFACRWTNISLTG